MTTKRFASVDRDATAVRIPDADRGDRRSPSTMAPFGFGFGVRSESRRAGERIGSASNSKRSGRATSLKMNVFGRNSSSERHGGGHCHLIPLTDNGSEQLGEATDDLVSLTALASREIQDLFNDINDSMQISRLTLEEADETLNRPVGGIDWSDVQKKVSANDGVMGERQLSSRDDASQAEHRLDDDCPICMMPLRSKMKARLLTSCGHVFHERCLASFEEFAPGRACCPMCRAPGFSKRLLANPNGTAADTSVALVKKVDSCIT